MKHVNNASLSVSLYWSVLSVVSLPVLADSVLPEVSVSAALDSQEERRMSSAGKLIFDRKELEATDSSTVGELLGKLPATGMFMDSSGGVPPRRGQGKSPNRNMPQILVDGQPLAGGDRNPASVLRLPVELIERVEIIRQSTPEFVVTGSGGVINIIMRDVPPKAMRNAKATVGSMDGRQSLRIDGQESDNKNNWGYLLSGSVDYRPQVGSRQSQTTTFSQGIAQTTLERARQQGEEKNFSFAPRLNFQLNQGQKLTISPFFSYTQDQRDVVIQRTLTPENNALDGERMTGRINTEWKQTGSQGAETSVKILLQAEDEDSSQLMKSQAVSRENTQRLEQEGLLELRAKRVLLETHVLTGAIEWQQKHSEEQQFKQQLNTTQSKINEERQVLWLQDEWLAHEKHIVTYGLRWQQIAQKIDDSQQGRTEQTHRTIAPSLHYLWQPHEQWNLRASIAAHQRPPRELSSVIRTATGVNSSSNPDRTGNPQLLAEKQTSAEAGIEYFLAEKKGNVGLSIFERHMDDYVQRLTLLENGRWLERPYNVGDARVRGVVVDAKAQLKSLNLANVTVRGNYAYSSNKMLSQFARLGAGEGARQSVNLGVDYQWKVLTVGASGGYISALDRESSINVIQQQGAQKNLTMYALYKVNRQLSLRFSAHNLTAHDRIDTLHEYDDQGQLVRLETDKSNGIANLLLSLEGRW